MEWLLVPAVPLLLCGAMCLGGMALGAIGVRRSKQSSCHDTGSKAATDETAVPAPR